MIVAVGPAIIAIGAASFGPAEHHPHWSYSGEGGPAHWAALDPKNAVCGNGRSQSPIDIRTKDVRPASLPKLLFDYQATPLHIINNGHSVQVNVDPGSSLKVGNRTYQLVQLHFHHPSEERINGKSSEMVAHLVHRDSTGALAVVAVLLEEGQASTTVQTLWSHLPKQKGHEADFRSVHINPLGLLPTNRSYLSYSGSLTTPPCSEGVQWFVLRSPSTLSRQQINAFAKLYPNNARPLQKLNGRQIIESR